MKVLMTADTVGGVWTYSIELARALEPHGVEVVLATMGAPLSESQAAEAGGLPNLQVAESAWKLEWMQEPWADVERAAEWLLELESRHSPDVVHLNGYAHGVLPWRAPLLVVGHSCVLSWWAAVKGEPAPAEEWARYRDAVRAGIRRARRVAAPTRAMLDALELHYGPLPPAVVIPNARDGARFTSDAKEPLVIGLGRLWDEGKNVAALGRVATEMDWPVYVAGDTTHPEGGTVSLGHARALGRLGPAELAGWLGRASIAAFPVRYEPFGLAALEAGLAGCALVLGDIPSLREVWGDAALFVPPDDDAALCDAIQRLIRDDWLRAALATRARSRAHTYTPERMARGYLEVYAELADAGTRKEDALCVS